MLNSYDHTEKMVTKKYTKRLPLSLTKSKIIIRNRRTDSKIGCVDPQKIVESLPKILPIKNDEKIAKRRSLYWTFKILYKTNIIKKFRIKFTYAKPETPESELLLIKAVNVNRGNCGALYSTNGKSFVKFIESTIGLFFVYVE